MSEYKTSEELKEELGDKFEDYMYKANIELLNQLQQKENIIKEVREYIENTDDFDIEIFDDSTGGCLGTDLSKGAKHILEILDLDKGNRI